MSGTPPEGASATPPEGASAASAAAVRGSLAPLVGLRPDATVPELIERLTGEPARGLAERTYAELFEIAPGARGLFPESMSRQMLRMADALVIVVSLADRPVELAPYLADLGARHRTYGPAGGPVQRDHYVIVLHALMRAAAHLTGLAWTSALASAWVEVVQVVATMMQAPPASPAPPPPTVGRPRHRRAALLGTP